MGQAGKAKEPCNGYFGNVCSGFGAPLTCLRCGWDLFDHPGPDKADDGGGSDG